MLMRAARKWGWVVDTPGLNRMEDVTEFRHVPPLFRRPSVVVAPSHAREFESPEVSLQTLGNHWKQASRRLQPTEALFCRRATKMGGLFDIFRIQRNRLYHERGDIELEDAGVLASSVLLLVRLASSDLVEPERLGPLAHFSRRTLMFLYSSGAGAPSDDTAEDGTANGAGEDAAPSADHMEVLTRIERNQQSLLGAIDSLPSAVCALMEERRDVEAVSMSSARSSRMPAWRSSKRAFTLANCAATSARKPSKRVFTLALASSKRALTSSKRVFTLALMSSKRALTLALTSPMRALTSPMRAFRAAFCWIIRPASINTSVARPIPVPPMLLMIALVSSVVRVAPTVGDSCVAASLMSSV